MTSRRLLLWTCGFALPAFCLLMVTQALPAAVGQPLAYAVQSATVFAAAGAMAYRARASSGHLRQARALLSASLVFATAGGLYALALHLDPAAPPPVPSPADAVHFLFFPLCVAGVLRYPMTGEESGSAARSLLDGLVATTALWFLVEGLVLAPIGWGSDMPTAELLTAVAYPAADVFVVAVAAGAVRRVTPEARNELACAAAGLTVYAVYDVAYTVLQTRGRYRADSWVSAVAECGLVLLLLATVATRPGSTRPPAYLKWLAVLPQLLLVAAVVVAAVLAAAGRVGPSLLGLLVAVLVALLLRQLTDRRDRRIANRRLTDREQLFRFLLTGSADLITMYDEDDRLRYVSPSVARFTGLAPECIDSAAMYGVVHPDDAAVLQAAKEQARERPGRPVEVMARLRNAAGEWRWCQVILHDLLDFPGVRGIVGNARDVHERHLLEQRIHHEAYHDALTGLGNLARARQQLADLGDPAEDGARTAVLALVDLDGFKGVNDTFGHEVGDALLRGVAAALVDAVGEPDRVTRIGGDEFLLFLRDAEAAEAVADRVSRLAGQPRVVDGRRVSIGASVGLVHVTDVATPDELLRDADLAMYAAKGGGRNRSRWYEPEMHAAAARRVEILEGVRRALDEGHLRLHYQPIVDLADGRTRALEALLRWQRPDGEHVPPGEFLPVVEETELMLDVDAWVLEHACRDLARWRTEGRALRYVSVNVSRRHLTPELPPLVLGTLRRHGLDPSALCVEITESAVAPDPDGALAVLTALGAAGVRLALDDFGTGESSLSQLARLPVDVVKVDKAFVLDSSGDPAALRLLTSILGVCDALRLPVIAEGIEHAGIVEHLRAAGCAYGQGFHFGRPTPDPVLPLGGEASERPAVPAPRAPGAEVHAAR